MPVCLHPFTHGPSRKRSIPSTPSPLFAIISAHLHPLITYTLIFPRSSIAQRSTFARQELQVKTPISLLSSSAPSVIVSLDLTHHHNMSSTAIDEIPIMIPSDTPSTTYENEVHFTTPPSLPADNDNDELIEALLEPDEICLTTNDIQSDPILSSLAKHQSQAKKQQPNLPTGSEMKQKVPFKARPAPPSTRAEGLGPRMTKSVALRLGMKWDDPKAYRQAGTGQEEGHDQAGGHKRAQSSTVSKAPGCDAS